ECDPGADRPGTSQRGESILAHAATIRRGHPADRGGLAAGLVRPIAILGLHVLPALARLYPDRRWACLSPHRYVAVDPGWTPVPPALRLLDSALVAVRTRQPVPAQLGLCPGARIQQARVCRAGVDRLLDRDAGDLRDGGAVSHVRAVRDGPALDQGRTVTAGTGRDR
ncbi:MAG: hypothetical protein AVDCRST_MAG87-792, partial [uncultured Thermomicrobiales bacterium]